MRKRVISVLLAAVLVLAGGSAVFAEGIDYSQWNSQSAYPSDVVNTKLFTPVKFLVDKKVIEGYEDGLFHAERNITRAEYTKMILIATNNHKNLDAYTVNDFTDVDGHWAKQYINTAVGLKLINGMGDGTFRPNDTVTYAQVIALLIRTKGISDSDMKVYGSWPDNYAKYATMYNMLGDVAVSDWNAPAVRGDVAKILYRNLPK